MPDWSFRRSWPHARDQISRCTGNSGEALERLMQRINRHHRRPSQSWCAFRRDLRRRNSPAPGLHQEFSCRATILARDCQCFGSWIPHVGCWMNALLRLRMCCRRLAPHAQACLHWLTGRRRNCTALCNSADRPDAEAHGMMLHCVCSKALSSTASDPNCERYLHSHQYDGGISYSIHQTNVLFESPQHCSDIQSVQACCPWLGFFIYLVMLP